MKRKIKEAVNYLKKFSPQVPRIGIILGSGLSEVASLGKGKKIPYQNIPGFTQPKIAGHPGNLIFSKVGKKKVVILQGRLHYYEGESWEKIIFPIRVLQKLGVKTLILTGAVGAINPCFSPPDLVLIKDHLNFMGDNPLRGEELKDYGEQFPPLASLYDPLLRKKMISAGEKIGLKIKEGVYLAVSGPAYETKAEVKAYSLLGADLVGMSLVPEAMVAFQGGMRVLGLVYVANRAGEPSLSHQEVLKTGKKQGKKLERLIKTFLETL